MTRTPALFCAAIAFACGGRGYFVCGDDAECGGASGVCEPNGACSFPDEDCDSGRRYGDASTPSIAGECVEIGPGSTGPSVGSTGSADDDSGPASSTSSSTTDPTSGPVAEGTTGDSCPSDWWDCSFAVRHRVSLAREIAEPLQDFVVLVLLGPTRVDYDRMQADAEDLRFVTPSGAEAAYEIERWDPTGVSTVWVRVDELGAGADAFWMYYGNPVAEAAPDPTEVWPEPWVAVWHLGAEPHDSTAAALHPTSAGTIVATAGQIDEASDFASSNAKLNVPQSPALADLFAEGATVSAWMRPRGTGGGGFGRIVNRELDGAGWMFFVGGPGRLRFVIGYEGGTLTWATPERTFVNHTWTHVALTFDGSAAAPASFWIDGVEVPGEGDVLAEGAVLLSDADLATVLGNRPANDRRFDGVLDEVRIERGIRSPEWIATEVASMRDELLVYGPIEGRDGAP